MKHHTGTDQPSRTLISAIRGKSCRRFLVPCLSLLTAAGLASCGGGSSDPDWAAGDASAEVSLSDGEAFTFTDGTCEAGTTATGNDSFVMRIGEPGADGEGLVVRIGLQLEGGATFAGDGSGNGLQVDHDGSRWGLAEGAEALRFDDDLTGGTIAIVGIGTLGEDPDPRTGTIEFSC